MVLDFLDELSVKSRALSITHYLMVYQICIQKTGPEDSGCSSITSVSLQYRETSSLDWIDVDGVKVGTTEVAIEDVPDGQYAFKLTVVNNRAFSTSGEGEKIYTRMYL